MQTVMIWAAVWCLSGLALNFASQFARCLWALWPHRAGGTPARALLWAALDCARPPDMITALGAAAGGPAGWIFMLTLSRRAQAQVETRLSRARAVTLDSETPRRLIR